MILVVEDEPNLVDVMSAVLQDEGYDVTTAANGAEALRALRDGLRPCLTILDLMMPLMSGWELRAAMLADPALSGIPVAVVSAFAGGDTGELQATAVLEKPFRLDRIVALADEHCGPATS